MLTTCTNLAIAPKDKSAWKDVRILESITREQIRQLASSETVFYRGMRYYAAHAVSKMTWNESSRQYRAIVKGGSKYVVTIEEEEGEIHYTCNCPAYVKYTGACKHVIAALLFILDYQKRQTNESSEEPEDKTAYQIVEYFRKREYRQLTPSFYHLDFKIQIPEFMKEQTAKAYVSLYAGQGKMYKVSNTKKFIQDYYEGNTIQLGKEFCFIPGECEFDEESKNVLDYLIEIYEVQQTLGKTYYSTLFGRQEFILSKGMLYKFLKLLSGRSCSLNLYGKEFEQVKVLWKNPDLKMNIELEKDVLRLSGDNEERPYSLTEDGSILFFDGTLYLPDKDYIGSLLPFYSALFHETGKVLEFRGENKNDFIEKVLPVIKKTILVSVPEKIRESYVVEPLEAQLYLDIVKSKTKCYVSASVLFVYGEYKIDPLRIFSSGNRILVRDKEEEERLTRILYDLNFKVSEHIFLLRGEEDIFSMMTEKMELLTDNFSVFYSKEYKSSSIGKLGQVFGQIRLDTGIDFLELNLEYSQIPQEELEDFFKSIRLKKKYYRLKKGTFINLQEQGKQMEMLNWLLENGQTTNEGSIRLSKYMALYLDEIFPKGNKIKKDASYEKLLQEIERPEKTEWEIPNGITAHLREYQKVGFQWLKTLAHYDMGGILADDMGLGKTLQAIIYMTSHQGERSLVVCPTSLAYNWQEEFEKFSPGIKTKIIAGTPEEREELLQNLDEVDVLITTYPLIRKDIVLYQDIKFEHMFIDEAQFIKNPGSLSAKAVKSIQAKHRFALTGTPIENALSELWSIFDYIMPGFFPKYHKFSEIYEKSILQGEDKNRIKELKLRIQPFILRRMKKTVLKEIPDKTESMRMAEMTKKQEKIYLSYLSRIQEEIKNQGSIMEGSGRIQILAALTRLRQICCHPGTFVENYTGGSGKLELLMEQLPDLLEAGHSVIVFSQFTSMLAIIEEELKKAGIGYFLLSGNTKALERKQYVKEFNEGMEKVFLISLKAGGTGLNLTGADTVIHFDPWWNPAVEEQATDRAYRIGQKRQVHVIKYVMKHSIEEKIYQLQKKKKELSDMVIDSGEVFLNQLTKEELLELFQA